MKIILLKDNILEGLKSVEKGVSLNSNLPVLRNVKLSANEKNEIILTTTNLEIAIQKTVSGKVINSGDVIVPFGILSNIVRNLNSDKVELEVKNNSIFIKSDNYEASINCENVDDFPIIPLVENRNKSIKINSLNLKEALSKVFVATQHSEVRPEINGVYISYDGYNLLMAGTDSFRLIEKQFKKEEVQSNFDEVNMVVPLKTVDVILKILDNDGDIEIFVSNNQIMIESENLLIISRIVDGKFPDYKSVIPKNSDSDIHTNKQEITSALKVTRVFSGKNNDITLGFNKNKSLEIQSSEDVLGQNIYRVPIKITGKNSSKSIRFNWRYLLDGVGIFESDDIILSITDESSPVLIKGKNDPDILYVVMPIRG